jgi:transcriptional regulator with XRE-family HTH domain
MDLKLENLVQDNLQSIKKPLTHSSYLHHYECYFMDIYNKIKFMRLFKGWSQEEMAEKLEMAVSGYAKIEQGKTDINFSRLQQIANLFEIELADLIRLSEKNVLNVIDNFNDNKNSVLSNISVSTPESDAKQEIEKLRLLNEQQMKEISYLKEIIDHLLKKEQKPAG